MNGSNASHLSDLSVLVVEDNEVNQKVISAMLQYFSIAPHIAENGHVAIEYAANNKYDLIFMDCQMPVKDGFETTKYIRQLKQKPQKDFKTMADVIIVAMTANASPDDVTACKEHGMNDFIAKPVELDVVTCMLEKWFAQ